MAQVYKETTKSGKIRWKIAYRDREGARRFMRVSRLNKKDAEGFAFRVDQLASAAAGNTSPAPDLIRWADGLPAHLRQKLIDARLVRLETIATEGSWLSAEFRERMIESGVMTPTETISDAWLAPEFRKRLADAGLVEPITGQSLGEWLTRFMAGHKDVKGATTVTIENAKRNLLDYFGSGRPVASITSHDAKEWRSWLAVEGNRRDATGAKSRKTPPRKSLADNTVRRRTGIARQFFAAAINAGLIERNPFDKLAATTRANEKRQFFVKAGWIEQCIKKAPCGDWTLILALCRYGGLRCPSEVLRLTWDDVDLPAGRMTIHAAKTEHHATGGVRQCPIFPELRKHLEPAYHAAPDGSVHLITRYRNATQNLRTTFELIIARAGLTPWPKLFQNLRASRETELLAVYPAKDVAAWLGNSVPVAMKHYAMPRAETFERAGRETTSTDQPAAEAVPADAVPAEEPAAE